MRQRIRDYDSDLPTPVSPGCATSYRRSPTDPDWQAHDISGPEGIKFDLIEPADLDADGDLDAVNAAGPRLPGHDTAHREFFSAFPDVSISPFLV